MVAKNEFDKIIKFFPNLTETQVSQFEQLKPLYEDWNAKINVISRKDMDAFYLHHVLHSLAIAKVVSFKPGTQIMDLGTGGGFPSIPLAILFPEVEFLAVDSIGKKIKVVQEVAAAIKLENLVAEHKRAEEVKQQFDFIVTRAVAPLFLLKRWTTNKYLKKDKNSIPNGLLALKGGNLKAEISETREEILTYSIKRMYNDAYFEEKFVLYMQA